MGHHGRLTAHTERGSSNPELRTVQLHLMPESPQSVLRTKGHLRVKQAQGEYSKGGVTQIPGTLG